MRVLALAHVFPRHGGDHVAPFLLAWARGLQAAGAEVAVVAPHAPGLPARHVVEGVPVRRVRYAPDGWERLAYRGRMHELARSPAGPALLAGLVAALARGVRAQVAAGRPDVLHVHWCLPGAVVALLAGVGVPVVVTVHGTDVALLESRPALAQAARRALAGAARVEAVSHDLATRLTAATGHAVDAIGPMPLATPASLPVAAGGAGHSGAPPGGALGPPTALPSAWSTGGDALRVVGVGRLVADKGFHDLVAAVARVGVPIRLTIVGEGPERGRLLRLAAGLGVALALPGALSPAGLRAVLAGADVVAQPSHREGLGLVAAEAVVAGVPVVATDSGGVRDVLATEDLVPVGDVDALAAALRRVADDPDTARTRTADRARILRALLSPGTVAARTLAGYRELRPAP